MFNATKSFFFVSFPYDQIQQVSLFQKDDTGKNAQKSHGTDHTCNENVLYASNMGGLPP